MTERLTVSGIGHRGDGIVETPRGPVFVPYALPGEIVEVDAEPGHPDRRHVIRVEHESGARIAPICAHFGTCGGCAMQHWHAPQYRAWKRDLVVSALTQAAIETVVAPLIDAHGEGRRRAVLHARRASHDVLAVGFAAARAHRIVAIDDCPILARSMRGVIESAWRIAEALEPLRKPLDIQATAANEGLDIDIRGSRPLGPGEAAKLGQIVVERNLARISRHGEIVAQRIAPTITIGRAKLALPPGAFLQPTVAGEAALAQFIAEALGSARNIADLFCGVGPFALRLAERARIAAADADAAAIAALSRAAASTPGLKPIAAQVRDLFRRPLVASELAGFDAVVFDPPRQGAQAQARALAASKVPMIAAVSCNPATFARDARILIGGGYRLARVTPVDQFRYSPHVEIVAQFVR